MPLPLTLLSTLDPVLRDTAVFSMLTDSPGMAAVRHEMVDIAGKGSGIRRLVLDATGVVEDVLCHRSPAASPVLHTRTRCPACDGSLTWVVGLRGLSRCPSAVS